MVRFTFEARDMTLKKTFCLMQIAQGMMYREYYVDDMGKQVAVLLGPSKFKRRKS